MAAPDTRPRRLLSEEGPEAVTTGYGVRQTWRQVGWLGASGAFYALDEPHMEHEPGGVSGMFVIAHADRLDDCGVEQRTEWGARFEDGLVAERPTREAAELSARSINGRHGTARLVTRQVVTTPWTDAEEAR
jgi:hypothetical protein